MTCVKTIRLICFDLLLFCLCVCVDNTQLDAQVSATLPRRQAERHNQAAMERVQDVRLQGDWVHRRHGLSEREGDDRRRVFFLHKHSCFNHTHISISIADHTAENRPQSVRQRLPRQRSRQAREKVSDLEDMFFFLNIVLIFNRSFFLLKTHCL